MRVIETLLTFLGNDDTDMIVILAGYSNEMNDMLKSNPGMKSRFPYIFNFEDYTPEQLMMIGKQVLEREQYTLSEEAERKLAKYIIYAYDHKNEHFGNGRFITRLITTNIIPSLSRRLINKPIEQISKSKTHIHRIIAKQNMARKKKNQSRRETFKLRKIKKYFQ